jgi:MFS transporter, FHS family, L-fucose permease
MKDEKHINNLLINGSINRLNTTLHGPLFFLNKQRFLAAARTRTRIMQKQTNSLTIAPALMTVVIGLYFYWGVLTLMNDLLVPLFKQTFHLNYFQATLVQFSFFASYLLCAIPAVWLLNKMNYKKTLIIGLTVLIAGSLFFIGASIWHEYVFILFALFILGSGVVIIQVAANPLLAQIGSKKTASARLALGHGFTALGFSITPFLLSAYVSMHHMKIIYFVIALVMFLSILWVNANQFNLPALQVNPAPINAKDKKALWLSPVFIGSFFGIFFYVGAEVSIGSLLVSYLRLPQIVHFSLQHAAQYLSIYWGGSMIGRFIGARLLMKRSAAKILTLHAIANIILLVGAVNLSGYWGMWSLLCIGLFNSIMFPVIFSLGLSCLKNSKHKNIVSACLAMATSGAAIIPVLQGRLADQIGLQHSFALLIVCYLYIAFFGRLAHRRTNVPA